MKKTHTLLLGAILVLFLTILWYYKIVDESIAAIGGSFFTILTLIISSTKGNRQNKSQKIKKDIDRDVSKMNIKLTHSGKGDNIAGNKVINK